MILVVKTGQKMYLENFICLKTAKNTHIYAIFAHFGQLITLDHGWAAPKKLYFA